MAAPRRVTCLQRHHAGAVRLRSPLVRAGIWRPRSQSRTSRSPARKAATRPHNVRASILQRRVGTVGLGGQSGAGRDLQRQAWQWALANRAGDGALPSGREIARQYGRHERWGRLVKRSGAAGETHLRQRRQRTRPAPPRTTPVGAVHVDRVRPRHVTASGRSASMSHGCCVARSASPTARSASRP